MNLLQQHERCIPSSKGASYSLLPTVAPETIGTFARAIMVERPVGSGRRATHCGISVLVHIATILLLLVLPLLSSETLHPYVRTQDLIVLPIAPRSDTPRASERSMLPLPRPALEAASFVPAAFVTRRRDEGAVGAMPFVDPATIDPRSFTDGTGNVLGGVLSHAFTPVVLAVPRNERQVLHSGGQVRQARLLSLSLQYPDMAKLAHISGKVILAAMIDTIGNVHRVHPLSGHPFLVAAAMDAVERANSNLFFSTASQYHAI